MNMLFRSDSSYDTEDEVRMSTASILDLLQKRLRHSDC